MAIPGHSNPRHRCREDRPGDAHHRSRQHRRCVAEKIDSSSTTRAVLGHELRRVGCGGVAEERPAHGLVAWSSVTFTLAKAPPR